MSDSKTREERREARRRNAVARALRSPHLRQQTIPDRKKKWLNSEDEYYYDDDTADIDTRGGL